MVQKVKTKQGKQQQACVSSDTSAYACWTKSRTSPQTEPVHLLLSHTTHSLPIPFRNLQLRKNAQQPLCEIAPLLYSIARLLLRAGLFVVLYEFFHSGDKYVQFAAWQQTANELSCLTVLANVG